MTSREARIESIDAWLAIHAAGMIIYAHNG